MRRRLTPLPGRLSLRRRVLLGAAIAAVFLAAGWTQLRGSEGETATADPADATVDAAPLPWKGEEKPELYDFDKPVKFLTAKKHGVEALPPASAGSNGSYTPRPAAERERVQAQTYAAGASSPDEAALLLGDTALAPGSAPAEIKAVIDAANQLRLAAVSLV